MTTTTNALEQQIAALLRQLEEMKEAERLEVAQKEAEAVVEKARMEEEQRRLQAEVEAEAERVRCDAEDRRVEQERHKREQEEEARRHSSRKESELTLLAAPETELSKSKGKGPELAPELEGVRESQRFDSCEKWNVECVRLKVRGSHLRFQQILTALQTGRSRSCRLCQELRIGAPPEVELRSSRNDHGRRTVVKGPPRGSE